MRIAAFGDIHSNHFALEACLEHAQRLGIDGVAFLGDFVTDCPNPQKTLALIREIAEKYPTWQIRGNREEYLMAHARNADDGWREGSRTGSLLYTYENLTREDISAFERIPIDRIVRIDGQEPFEICHGAPWQTRYMLLPGTREADEVLKSMRTRLLLCAHTHSAFVLEKDGKVIVNGGAVGAPSNGCADAGYILIESVGGHWIPRLARVKYDFESAIREFFDTDFVSKANVWAKAVAASMRTGRNYPQECIKMVECDSVRLGVSMDCEALWERAASTLEIQHAIGDFRRGTG